MPDEKTFAKLRDEMVSRQLEGRGIVDKRVLQAMRKVPRHRFVPEEFRSEAYADKPLPLGIDQTVSQPYIVGYMLEALCLKGDEKVLEVGAGSGYECAVLAHIVPHVWTIEIDPVQTKSATETLLQLGYSNVSVRCGDGFQGWKEHAPFDAIVVSAAPEHIPRSLVAQLAVGGRMVLPLGTEDQVLVLLEKTKTGLESKELCEVRFVPMKEGT